MFIYVETTLKTNMAVTLIVLVLATFFFATEILSVDMVALLIIVSLILSGVVTPEEGVSGFSNPATLTVAFMFVISSALLKTGALQKISFRLARVFEARFKTGLLMMMILIALISAFINNTPVVAVFIPVVMQIAHQSRISPSKLLIPLSFASIFGGSCTLIGTSTNIIVSELAQELGAAPFSMFEMTPVGLLLLFAGIGYMLFVGIRLLPARIPGGDLDGQFDYQNYITDLELLPKGGWEGKRIMDSLLFKELQIDVLHVFRDGQRFTQPPGDFILQDKDRLRIRSSLTNIKEIKNRARILGTTVLVGRHDMHLPNTTLVEMIVAPGSNWEGKTLKELDFRKKYRAMPLAIRHREDIQHENLYHTLLKPGDVILSEIKSHYLEELKKAERQPGTPYILFSEAPLYQFNKKHFHITLSVLLGIVLLVAFYLTTIMTATLCGTLVLLFFRVLRMKEVYEAINWKIIFLLAGALALSKGMINSGLDELIAHHLILKLGGWGPVILVSGLYLFTSILTEIMSNNAAAALLAPIAVGTAQQLGVNPTPLLIAITLAASASFMTPVGYQTNAMVFATGQYRYADYLKVGLPLNVLFWLLATLLIPIFYSFE